MTSAVVIQSTRFSPIFGRIRPQRRLPLASVLGTPRRTVLDYAQADVQSSIVRPIPAAAARSFCISEVIHSVSVTG